MQYQKKYMYHLCRVTVDRRAKERLSPRDCGLQTMASSNIDSHFRLVLCMFIYYTVRVVYTCTCTCSSGTADLISISTVYVCVHQGILHEIKNTILPDYETLSNHRLFQLNIYVVFEL